MLKNFLFLVPLILFQFTVEIKSQFEQFKPLKRGGHTATLINDRLYILGGYSLSGTEDEIVGQDFFYLNVSEPFTAQEIKWVDFNSINLVPPHRRAAAVGGGENDDKIILYGGDQITRELAIVYTFDTQGLSWSTPKIMSSYQPLNKSSLFPVIDHNGKMYLFGGYLLNNNNNIYVSDMAILDIVRLSFTQGSSINAPTPRGYYGAVLLPDQKIIYIGGSATGQALPLDVVYLYDTINDEWSSQLTTGKIPSNRDAFSAVLGQNSQKVIIYGGRNVFTSDSLYELNVNNWEWYIPKVYGTFPAVTPYSHRAVLIDKYMVITFGDNYNQTTHNEIKDISFLDISRNDVYIWTNIFIPNPTKVTPVVNTTPRTPLLAPPPISLIAAVLTSLVSLLLLSLVCYFSCKKVKGSKGNKEEKEEKEKEGKGKNDEEAINS